MVFTFYDKVVYLFDSKLDGAVILIAFLVALIFCIILGRRVVWFRTWSCLSRLGTAVTSVNDVLLHNTEFAGFC